jgi:hypothetical protein
MLSVAGRPARLAKRGDYGMAAHGESSRRDGLCLGSSALHYRNGNDLELIYDETCPKSFIIVPWTAFDIGARSTIGDGADYYRCNQAGSKWRGD